LTVKVLPFNRVAIEILLILVKIPKQ